MRMEPNPERVRSHRTWLTEGQSADGRQSRSPAVSAGRRAPEHGRPLSRATAQGPDDCNAVTLSYEPVDVPEALRELAGGRRPDACIGVEAHGHCVFATCDRANENGHRSADRLRDAILACRRGSGVRPSRPRRIS
jgi:hypothetical protein